MACARLLRGRGLAKGAAELGGVEIGVIAEAVRARGLGPSPRRELRPCGRCSHQCLRKQRRRRSQRRQEAALLAATGEAARHCWPDRARSPARSVRPDHRLLRTPGAPSSASTASPESSAKVGMPLLRKKYCAFASAFSSNVCQHSMPSSSSASVIPASSRSITSRAYSSNKWRSSRSLPGFRVARR